MVKATAECSPAATAHGCLVGGKGPLRSQKARGIRGRLCEPHMEEADLPGSGRPYDHAYCFISLEAVKLAPCLTFSRCAEKIFKKRFEKI